MQTIGTLTVALAAVLAAGGVAQAGESMSASAADAAKPPESRATDAGSPFEFALSAAWDSHYVSEGRDNLDGDSLVGTTFEAAAYGFTAGAWYASSPNANYSELNLYGEYALELGDFEVYAGYTYLNFPADDADDHEVGAGIAYGGLPFEITPAIDWYHSFEADGSFFEASISGELELLDWLELEPFALIGWNEGYIADGHNGANNVAIGIVTEIDLSNNVELSAYLAYNWAIDSNPDANPDDQLLKDFLYGGVAIDFEF